MSDDQENEEEYNQQNQQEQQRITNLLQKQMFQGTPETPSPQGFNANSQYEHVDPQDLQGSSTYDQAFINAQNLVSESFFMKGKQNRYLKFKAINDLIDVYEKKQPLPDYTKISLYNYHI
jgi:hypothetical protein